MAVCDINCKDIDDIFLTEINGHPIGDGNFDIAHAELVLLEADDHPQYVPVNGTRNIMFNSGTFEIGDVIGGNYTQFEADGTMRFAGDATVWEDLRVPGLAVKTGASAPDLEAFLGAGGLLAYAFAGAATLEQVYFAVQIPHSYKQGTNIKSHVHWSPTTADAGNAVWQLEYTWANIGGTFGASTTIKTTAQAAGGTAWVHNMAIFPDIEGTGKEISSMLVCRLFRDPGDAGDTYAHDASFLEFDIHYESDTVGSRSVGTK